VLGLWGGKLRKTLLGGEGRKTKEQDNSTGVFYERQGLRNQETGNQNQNIIYLAERCEGGERRKCSTEDRKQSTVGNSNVSIREEPNE